MKVTLEQVRDNLPSIPDDRYTYEVERISPMVVKVWLRHHFPYDYACGKPVKTIYCYLKNEKVHAPKSKDKMQVKSICTIDELSSQPWNTTIVPSGPTNLWHLK